MNGNGWTRNWAQWSVPSMVGWFLCVFDSSQIPENENSPNQEEV